MKFSNHLDSLFGSSIGDWVATGTRYFNAFSNFHSVLLARLSNRYPVRAVLRKSGHAIELDHPLNAYYISWYESLDWPYDLGLNLVTVGPPWRLTFRGALAAGDLMGIYSTGIYKDLDVEGRTVVDVGASIGDSAIYFALKGAQRVIAYEPSPEAFECAFENVSRNGMLGKVTLINAAVGVEGAGSDRQVALRESSDRSGNLNPSLRTITDTYSLDGAVLKLDCEGCEYGLLDGEKASLERFKQIQLEYHIGLRGIDRLLEESGFQTTVKPRSRSVGEILAVK